MRISAECAGVFSTYAPVNSREAAQCCRREATQEVEKERRAEPMELEILVAAALVPGDYAVCGAGGGHSGARGPEGVCAGVSVGGGGAQPGAPCAAELDGFAVAMDHLFAISGVWAADDADFSRR